MAWRFSLPSNRRTPLLQIMQMRKATISPRAFVFSGIAALFSWSVIGIDAISTILHTMAL
ncbi:hypothetical protein I7I50_11991 [Histoplasma capsulatum G186AR]|uniref:Uncharacterized protein n=1 Tax=Ajellomyces capsulatus TaxID=5037 RepID=A0A8H7YDF4_AJECA|nr:hypothetical protein I7I52_11690 [Histoplasma capsulatum]QSS70380.1 hypothetical protein I7I50_11991 [Histoplasma capsulatum G186AR]